MASGACQVKKNMEYEDTLSAPLHFKSRAGSRRNPEEAEHDPKTASIPLLPIYLREMGATPLLTQEREVALARELQEAREAVARQVMALPAECRAQVQSGDLKGLRRGHAWPLEQLEACCAKVLVYDREHEGSAASTTIRELKRQKRRLDQARDSLILANLRLVTHIAKKYSNQGIAFMDLIQEGNIGLMKAVEKFEYLRGYRFSTYAYWWIKQAVTRAIADKARLIRIPVHVSEKVKRLNRVSTSLTDTLGRKPTSHELARKMRMSVQQVEEILEIVQDAQSLENFGNADDPAGVLPFVADPNAENPVKRTIDRELCEKMRSALNVLDKREEEIIRLRFGIGRDVCHTLEAIGKKVQLSRERVRQIEAIALRKIQATQESQDLRKHLIA